MNRIKVPFGRKKKPKLPVEDISALSSMEFDYLLHVLNEHANRYTYYDNPPEEIRKFQQLISFHLANKLTKQQTFSNIELGILNRILENRNLPIKERETLGDFVLLWEMDQLNNSNEFITQLTETGFQLVENIAYVRLNDANEHN
ncbi:hypothetical protein ACS2CL_20010 [Bacillus cereus group sp. BceL296]|uniref:hypothetical protein n=1 Tax=Bacillus cereus group TaxID=86661 RepID=UPI00065B6C99|nr:MULTISPECIES: hypothetical protein [Bacillus cereus group]KMQ18747.1 hypothetical protein TU69_20105 [Bacillus cereus]MCU5391223.1 hypothetical protein [Bacillus paranthracis]MDA1624109.1 hypothetical protein [Bacillus cereus group sp. TH206-1LC]MDA1751226.1 hypothetical protein [Bacillus cereus group sp. LD113LC]MDA1822971.1 hypothetical protein [Bacillus cereus group sp. BY2-1LC]